MIEDIKNFKVNWIDGMKISKEHFIQLQSYVQDSMKDVSSLLMGKHDYGFVSSYLSESQEFLVNIDAHKNLKVAIKKLRAITPNGSRIEITSHTPNVKEEITIDELENSDFDSGYVVLNYNAEENVAFGEQNVKEVPPRYPFLTQKYFISFSKASELETSGIGPNQLPIAKIVKDGNALAVSQEYIPPSISLAADENLISFYNTVETFLKMTERHSIQIVQKISGKDSDNAISDTLLVAVDKIYTYLAQEITMIKSEEYDLTPRKLMGVVISFARLFKNAVDVAPSQNKELLFNYFGEWTDLKGGDFEKLFTSVINQQYKHHDVAENIHAIHHFMKVIGQLFTLLTQVDYIGKRRDMGIFVNENVIKDDAKSKAKLGGSPSFLAE